VDSHICLVEYTQFLSRIPTSAKLHTLYQSDNNLLLDGEAIIACSKCNWVGLWLQQKEHHQLQVREQLVATRVLSCIPIIAKLYTPNAKLYTPSAKLHVSFVKLYTPNAT
jgi:hypothetical protein